MIPWSPVSSPRALPARLTEIRPGLLALAVVAFAVALRVPLLSGGQFSAQGLDLGFAEHSLEISTTLSAVLSS